MGLCSFNQGATRGGTEPMKLSETGGEGGVEGETGPSYKAYFAVSI